MVSRIAAYYQQRCKAMAEFQHQRCQQWANVHRQKSQSVAQAATLVVAWYIRDRIQRRRKRDSRHFKKGLTQKCSRDRISKGESVRKWVLGVTDKPQSPNDLAKDVLVDRQEAEFDMDKETGPDKDAELFNIANIVKCNDGPAPP